MLHHSVYDLSGRDRDVLRLSRPAHAARLPFDFLLHSLAEAYGERAGCVLLLGTGVYGSAGLKAIAAQGGMVVAQAPNEAGHDNMPRSAIATGAVDLVLRMADIPAALLRFQRRTTMAWDVSAAAREPGNWLPDIIKLLRTRTIHDFSFYKVGTMKRRVEQRIALAAIGPNGMENYFALLRRNPEELALAG